MCPNIYKSSHIPPSLAEYEKQNTAVQKHGLIRTASYSDREQENINNPGNKLKASSHCVHIDGWGNVND